MRFAGESLAQRLRSNGALELNEVLRIGIQAADGLAAAHAQGLIRRDVKPANILLERGVERAVLTDFGLARAADDVSMTRQGIIAGTPEYMSPEQASGGALDGRSDLFSLGCVLYEMATGVSPFRTDSTVATIRRIVDEQHAKLSSLAPELPPWFSRIVERLLSKDPAQRFGSANEVKQVLEECLSHLQQPASAELPKSLTSPAAGRRSYLTSGRRGTFSLLGAIGATLLGFAFFQATQAPDIAGEWSGADWGNVTIVASTSGRFTGKYSGEGLRSAGDIELKWSRIERRFNGSWRDGSQRLGRISLRVVDDELDGGWTTDKDVSKSVEFPRLGSLKWKQGPSSVFPKTIAEALVRVSYQAQCGSSTIRGSSLGWVIDDAGHILVHSMFIEGCHNEQIELSFSSGQRCSAKRIKAFGQLTLLKSERIIKVPVLPLDRDGTASQGDSVVAILNGKNGVAGKVTTAAKTLVINELSGLKITPPLRLQNVIMVDVKRDVASLNGAPVLTKAGAIAGMAILLSDGDLPVIPIVDLRAACEQLQRDDSVDSSQPRSNASAYRPARNASHHYAVQVVDGVAEITASENVPFTYLQVIVSHLAKDANVKSVRLISAPGSANLGTKHDALRPERLQGTWWLTASAEGTNSLNRELEPVVDRENDVRRIEFRGDVAELTLVKGNTARLRYSIDSSRYPAAIDWNPEGTNFVLPGLVELDGDTLKLSISNNERPLSQRPSQLGPDKDVGYFEFRRDRAIVDVTSPPNTRSAVENDAILESIQGTWAVEHWTQSNKNALHNDDLEYSLVIEQDLLYQVGKSKSGNGVTFTDVRRWGRINIDSNHEPVCITILDDKDLPLRIEGVLAVQGDRLTLTFLQDHPDKSLERPQSGSKFANGDYLECRKVAAFTGKLSSGLIFGNRADIVAADGEGRLLGPRYPLEFTCYTGRINPACRLVVKTTSTDGFPELSGRVNCLLPGSIARIEWKFKGYSGANDVDDNYEFSITPPRTLPDGAPKKVDVHFNGKQVILYETPSCIVVLDKPAEIRLQAGQR